MDHTLTKAVRIFICAIVTVQLTGCGTLMYPERKGQKTGHIDSGVAILDGIGLLFFVIPGLIAFVVDFNNGTIYLPGTARVSVDMKDIRQVKFDPKRTSQSELEAMLRKETGKDIKLDRGDIAVSKLKSDDEIPSSLSKV